MVKQHFITAMMLIFLTHSVFAHDGEEHISDLDFLIAVVGLIAISGALFYSFVWNHPQNSNSNAKDTDRDTK